MPMYDRLCESACGWSLRDTWEPVAFPDPPCPICGQPTARGWLSGSEAHINRDECDYVDENLGPEPIRIRSWSQRRQLMKERGLVEVPKYPRLPPAYVTPEGEADRLAHWHAHEDSLELPAK